MLFGEGFRAFVTDWDKVTATVSRGGGCSFWEGREDSNRLVPLVPALG